jgi:hypothetical protein
LIRWRRRAVQVAGRVQQVGQFLHGLGQHHHLLFTQRVVLKTILSVDVDDEETSRRLADALDVALAHAIIERSHR